MAECPFCKAPIDEDLSRFGGHCPKCVIEIPGDETPTDPGVAKRAEVQAAEERRRSWSRATAVGGLAVVAIGGTLCVTAWRIGQQHEAQARALRENQENAFYIAPASEHRLPIPGAAVAAEPEGKRNGRVLHRPVPVAEARISSGSSGEPARYDFIGGSDEEEPELADLAHRTVEVAPGSVEQGGFGPGVPTIEVSRGSVDSLALADAVKIRESVGGALRSYAQQMTACYERRLKNSPTLRGTWDAGFTILQSGRTMGVVVVPRGAGDPELERCMAETIGRWTFQTMVEPQQIEKAYTFGPSE